MMHVRLYVSPGVIISYMYCTMYILIVIVNIMSHRGLSISHISGS